MVNAFDSKKGPFTHRMCTLFSLHGAEVWSLGSSISNNCSEQTLQVINHQRNDKLTQPQQIGDWKKFKTTLVAKARSCQKRVILICDISKLDHATIADMRRFRERHAWFAPVVYFDQPDLGKVIHTFDSNLAGYYTHTDTAGELTGLLRSVSEGKLYYSRGFCTMLRHYGFPVEETLPN